jgi:hypothetical protein
MKYIIFIIVIVIIILYYLNKIYINSNLRIIKEDEKEILMDNIKIDEEKDLGGAIQNIKDINQI